MRSALLRRKITGRCVRSSVSSAAGSYGKRRRVSITIRLRRHATSRAGEHEPRSERSSDEYQEILRVEAATHRTARSGGVSGMLHRTTVRWLGAGLIEGIVLILSDFLILQPRSAKISVWICFPFTATSPSRRVRYFSFAFASVAPLTMTRASYSGVFVNSSRREARFTPSPMTV